MLEQIPEQWMRLLLLDREMDGVTTDSYHVTQLANGHGVCSWQDMAFTLSMESTVQRQLFSHTWRQELKTKVYLHPQPNP